MQNGDKLCYRNTRNTGSVFIVDIALFYVAPDFLGPLLHLVLSVFCPNREPMRFVGRVEQHETRHNDFTQRIKCREG